MIRAKNPILPGFYPDPSICRVGNDYYIVNSTFAYFPGIPVFHSRNLADWKQIGNVLTRSSQVVLDGCGHSEGIYAPTIRYHDGIFYVITTNVSGGGNFIVAAKNPAGPWTDPVYLGEEAQGIDPSLFFDEDGSCWYVGQRERTGGGAYFGDCEIWVRQLNLPEIKRRLFAGSEEADGVQGVPAAGNFREQSNYVGLEADDIAAVIRNENTAELLDTHRLFLGSDTVLAYGYARKAVWAEGPHLYRKDGYYYLVHAEMGTEQNHCVVVARSRALTGPYEYNLANPILTHRHLGRDYPVTCVGHADLVEDGIGNWYLVALGCRPLEGHTLMGRETFLAKATWEEDWPVVNAGIGRLEEEVEIPGIGNLEAPAVMQEETLARKENGERLEKNWAEEKDAILDLFLTLRGPSEKLFDLLPGHGLRLYPKNCTLKDKDTPACLMVRQRHHNFFVEAGMILRGRADVSAEDGALSRNVDGSAEYTDGTLSNRAEDANTKNVCAGLVYMQSNENHLRLECYKQEQGDSDPDTKEMQDGKENLHMTPDERIEKKSCTAVNLALRLIKCYKGQDQILEQTVLPCGIADEIRLKISVKGLRAFFEYGYKKTDENHTYEEMTKADQAPLEYSGCSICGSALNNKPEKVYEWRRLGKEVDLRFMSTESAGGFVGCTAGMYAFFDEKFTIEPEKKSTVGLEKISEIGLEMTPAPELEKESVLKSGKEYSIEKHEQTAAKVQAEEYADFRYFVYESELCSV